MEGRAAASASRCTAADEVDPAVDDGGAGDAVQSLPFAAAAIVWCKGIGRGVVRLQLFVRLSKTWTVATTTRLEG